MTYATPKPTPIEPTECSDSIPIIALHMRIGDSIVVFARDTEYTLSLRDDAGTIALCLSQTMPQYGYARTYNSTSTLRTEHYGFVVTDKELEEEDQPDAGSSDSDKGR